MPRLGGAERLLLSFGGAGRIGFAPGTWGSLLAALLIALAAFGPAPGQMDIAPWCALALFVFGTVACLAWAGDATNAAGRHDPGWVVADEVAGQAIATAAVLHTGAWPAHVLAFVCFRIFDITKPPGVRHAESLPGGAGVLADDLVAGVYAGLLSASAWALLG